MSYLPLQLKSYNEFKDQVVRHVFFYQFRLNYKHFDLRDAENSSRLSISVILDIQRGVVKIRETDTLKYFLLICSFSGRQAPRHCPQPHTHPHLYTYPGKLNSKSRGLDNKYIKKGKYLIHSYTIVFGEQNLSALFPRV